MIKLNKILEIIFGKQKRKTARKKKEERRN
jgi:hypothetical protein